MRRTALLAAIAGVGLAIAIGSAGASTQTVTLGSTSGTPSQNVCAGSLDCTYAPFSNVSTPELQVPFDGTVTSFSVNSGSSSNTVELRVLRPASGGQFTGAGTSPAEPLSGGVSTFAVSLPVKAGDVLGLDNASDALLFDNTDPTAVTAYYELPPLADGSTAAPNHRSDYRLLLSATVQSSGTTTTGTTTTTTTTATTTTTTTTTPTTATGVRPVLTNVRQSHRVWREGDKLASFARTLRSPVGTTFSFKSNEPARVSLTFKQQLAGRKLPRGALSFSAHAGANKVRFEGRISKHKQLKPGRYALIITATNAAGQRSNRATLSFTIVKP
jgi:hypothetical protein